jgi:hypothetical protein
VGNYESRRRLHALDGRILAGLRAMYGAPPAETVDWWSLRRRISEEAFFGGRVSRRTLWDLALWRRALIPVTVAATVVMALAFADARSTMVASANPVAADSSAAAAWFRAASVGGAISQGELDPLLETPARIHGGGGDAWLGAAMTPTSD